MNVSLLAAGILSAGILRLINALDASVKKMEGEVMTLRLLSRLENMLVTSQADITNIYGTISNKG